MPHLLVHQTLMRAKLEADAAENEEDVIVVALGLEGVTVQEFVLTGKGKGLELESVEEVERDEDGHLVATSDNIHREGIHIEAIDGVGRGSHDSQVFEQTLEALVVGLFHQLQDDAVGQDTITLLPFGVLDVGPVFRGIRQVGQTLGVTHLVEYCGEVLLGGRGVGHGGSRRRHDLFVEKDGKLSKKKEASDEANDTQKKRSERGKICQFEEINRYAMIAAINLNK